MNLTLATAHKTKKTNDKYYTGDDPGEREAGNLHRERENEKWEQNLTWTLAL